MSEDQERSRTIALAAAVRKTRSLHRKRAPAVKDDAATNVADAILGAIEGDLPLPSRRSYRGPEFVDVPDELVFGPVAGVEYIEGLRPDGLCDRHGDAILQAMSECHELDEDEAHWNGPDGELLRAIVDGEAESRISVKRAVNPFNPVCLLTPPSEHALTATAAEPILAGEPIALYSGDLVAEGESTASNTYLYALDMDELRRRGYKGPSTQLRVDASRAGSEGRFVNDKFGGGVGERRPNCYIDLIFDGEHGEFVLVFFASRRIAKNSEIIADYGDAFWEVATDVLLQAHKKEAATLLQGSASGGKRKR